MRCWSGIRSKGEGMEDRKRTWLQKAEQDFKKK